MRCCYRSGHFRPHTRCATTAAHALRFQNGQTDSQDFAQCRDLWAKLASADGRWGRDWALAALAAAQRTELSLAAFADAMYGHVQVWRARQRPGGMPRSPGMPARS